MLDGFSLISLRLTVRTVASSVAHMLAVLVCGTKTHMIGMSRLYAVHDHVRAEIPNEELTAEISRTTEDL